MGTIATALRPGARLAGYRLRATFRARFGGLLGLTLLVGLLGGVAMASVVAARWTASSYTRFLAGTNPPDLLVQPTTTATCASHFVAAISRLPDVKQSACAMALNGATVTPRGGVGTILVTQVELVASSNGLFSGLDRPTLTAGRRPRATAADEVMASPEAVALFHLRVGSRLLVGAEKVVSNGFEGPSLTQRFVKVVDLRVVGLAVVDNQVVQDDIDRGHTGLLFGTAALAHEFASCCTALTYVGIKTSDGSSQDATVENEYSQLVSSTFKTTTGQLQVYVTASIATEAERAIRPEAVALGAFGAIAALATLVIGGQAMSRLMRARTGEAMSLRALGATPFELLCDMVLGIVVALVVGCIMAEVVAGALSPLADVGPVRNVDPVRGMHLDWTVLAFGALAFTALLGAACICLALMNTPRRPAAGRERPVLGRLLPATSRLPTPAMLGLRFALDPGQGPRAAPVRSALAGTAVAVAVITATGVFGASLGRLISQPARYGWDFDYALFSTDGYGPIPTAVVGPKLRNDRYVAASTGAWFATMEIDHQTVPVIVEPTGAQVVPPVLSGRSLQAKGQVVLGAATLEILHKHIGETVLARGDGIPPARLRIVGTATLPTIGETLGSHPSMDGGAVVPVSIVPKSVLAAYGPFSGPNAIFVRLKPGSGEAGRASLQAIVNQMSVFARSPQVVRESNGGSLGILFELLPPQRPAEIVNDRAASAMPAGLAGALAVGTVAAFALTILASVRRRRRDFALLKTLGFTPRQVALTVAWHATTTGLFGVIVGMPIGVALGRWLWEVFAHQLSVVPDPAVPALWTTVVALGALGVVNVVAALPGRLAARTPAALALRAE